MLYSMLCKAKLKLLMSCEGTLIHCRLKEKMSVNAMETSVFTVVSETPGLGGMLMAHCHPTPETFLSQECHHLSCSVSFPARENKPRTQPEGIQREFRHLEFGHHHVSL